MTQPDQPRAWLGTGWSFPPEFDRHSKDVIMVSEEEDIKQSLEILLSTAPGERIMHPSYGCGLKQLTFENLSESTLTEIQDVIDRAILFFERRIKVDSIEVDVENVYDGIMTIEIKYTISITNSRDNMVYPFYFREGAGPVA